MSNERSPLYQRSSRSGPAQYDGEQSFSADQFGSDHVRLRRSTVYCLIGYGILASILAMACLLALLFSHTGNHHQPYHLPPPVPLPKPSDSSSPSMHGPLPARRDWNTSHLGHFLVLTDIHLEPHYNATAPNAQFGVCRDQQHLNACTDADWEPGASHHSQPVTSGSSSYQYGRYMCDPPYSLVSTALHSLATTLAAVQQFDFILLPGDLAAHFIACPRTLYATINRTLELVTTAFPATPLIFAIGNTDTYPTSTLPASHTESEVAVGDDDSSSGRSQCRTVFSNLLDVLLLHGVLDARSDSESVRTFCYGGFYSKYSSDGRIRILSLNTLLWAQQLSNGVCTINRYHSAKSIPQPTSSPVPCQQRSDDPFGQLAWLEEEVRQAAEQGQYVMLVGHIPPGVKAGEQGWCWQYWQRLEQLLHRYESVITALQFGDYSQDMIRLVRRRNTAPPSHSQHHQQQQQHHSSSFAATVSHVIHINPGLSPRKNVNPAARIYTFQRHNSRIVDYQQLYIDLTRTHTSNHTPLHWLFQYNALDAYGLGEYGAGSWLDAMRRMRWGSGDGVLLERYMRSVNVWKAGVGDGVDYLCDVMVMGLQDNVRCKRTGVVPGLEMEEEQEEEWK